METDSKIRVLESQADAKYLSIKLIGLEIKQTFEKAITGKSKSINYDKKKLNKELESIENRLSVIDKIINK